MGVDRFTFQLHIIPSQLLNPNFGEFPDKEILESGVDRFTFQLYIIPTQQTMQARRFCVP